MPLSLLARKKVAQRNAPHGAALKGPFVRLKKSGRRRFASLRSYFSRIFPALAHRLQGDPVREKYRTSFLFQHWEYNKNNDCGKISIKKFWKCKYRAIILGQVSINKLYSSMVIIKTSPSNRQSNNNYK